MPQPTWDDLPVEMVQPLVWALVHHRIIPRPLVVDARPVWNHLPNDTKRLLLESTFHTTHMYAATSTSGIMNPPSEWSYDDYPYTPLEQVSMVKITKKQTTPIDMLVVEEDPNEME